MNSIRMIFILLWIFVSWPVWVWRERDIWGNTRDLWKVFRIPIASVIFLSFALFSATQNLDTRGVYLLAGAAFFYLFAGFLLWVIASISMVAGDDYGAY